jgi:hypothetical protein
LKVQVVRDEHEISRSKVLADTTACVREDERFGPESPEDPHAEDDPVGGMPLIEMRTALHDGKWYIRKRPEHQGAAVPQCCSDGPARDLAIRDLDSVLDPICEPAEA